MKTKPFYRLSNGVALYVAAFIITALALYIAFLSLDAVNAYNASALIKYTSIIICFIFSAIGICFYKADGAVMATALLLTVIADAFLVILEKFALGVTVFVCVQIIYLFRIYLTNSKPLVFSVGIRILSITSVIIALAYANAVSYLTAITVIYFFNLVANFSEALPLIKISKKYLLLFMGLLLFICCDICVGLGQFNSVFNAALPVTLISLAKALVWVFYLPSQVLLVLSARKTHYKLRLISIN